MILRDWISNKLENATPWRSLAVTGSAAFIAYFCVYALRKPFSVCLYSDQQFLASSIELKTSLVTSQMVGYALSKYLGIYVCSRVPRKWVFPVTTGLVVFAEVALVFFGTLPGSAKTLAIFATGLPLGMIWGMLVRYLEGRQSTELLIAILSCSYIAAAGVVKDIGNWSMQAYGVSEDWMPAIVGGVFLVPMIFCTWILSLVPTPGERDKSERMPRVPMKAQQQRDYVMANAAGLLLLATVYLFIVGYRDFRDNFGIELLSELGLAQTPAIFTKTEWGIAVLVALMLGALSLVRRNRICLLITFSTMVLGTASLGVGTFFWQRGTISNLTWFILIGLGVYAAFAPYAVVFERMMAVSSTRGTSVLLIYLIDSFGYAGSVVVQLSKDVAQIPISHLAFLVGYSYLLSVLGSLMLMVSALYVIPKQPHESEAP